MPYETGVASSPEDLMTKLCTFAVANGWTSRSPTSGRVITKGSMVIGLNATSTDLQTRAALAHDNAAAWNAQTNNSGVTHSCNLGPGPYSAYHFYSLFEESKELLAACVEIFAGTFRHWIVCDLVKAGTYTGGTYTDSVNWNLTESRINVPDSAFHRVICDTAHTSSTNGGQIWVDSDGGTNTWAIIRPSPATLTVRDGFGSVRTNGKWAKHQDIGTQAWNLRTPLWPIEPSVCRGSNLVSPLGRVPSMRQVNMRNHTPGEIITIGGFAYQLWPIVARTDVTGISGGPQSSGYYGYAYKLDA